jgi:hypothetical protein
MIKASEAFDSIAQTNYKKRFFKYMSHLSLENNIL